MIVLAHFRYRVGTAGGLTRAPLPHRFVDRSSGVAVRYPAGWRVDQRALTRLLSPRQLLVVSSFPIRQRRPDPNCTPSTAIKELPPTGVFLFLLESSSPVQATGPAPASASVLPAFTSRTKRRRAVNASA